MNKIISLKRIIKVFEEIESETRRVIIADEFKVRLPVFYRKYYNTWKKRRTIFLKMKNVKKLFNERGSQQKMKPRETMQI